MSWARTVSKWNNSGHKVIVDANDVYALPLKGTAEYNVVKELYEHKREKAKRKEIEKEENRKREILKPAAIKVQKFIDDIYEDFTEKPSVKQDINEEKLKAEELVKRREKASEGLKKVAAEAAERNKQRKREADERAMMAGEEVHSKAVSYDKLIKKEKKGTLTQLEASDLFDNKYVEGYEFKDRKDMAIAVRAFRIALPDFTSSVDILAKFFMKKGFKGKEYEIAFKRGASRPGKTFVQAALNNEI